MNEGSRVVGVDGYPRGWVGATLDSDGTLSIRTFRAFAEVAALDVQVIAVDIPIGIPHAEARPADAAARRFVGPRASSVFTTPPRAALEAATFAQAVESARGLTGKGLSQQAYALRHRILEVDALAEADARIVEVHPEVSFRELAGRVLAHSKHRPEGREERRALLLEAGLEAPATVGVPETDLLDALVAAWTAARYRRSEARSLPEDHHQRVGAIWR